MTAFAFFEKKKTETHFSEENSKMAIPFLRAGWIELGLEQQIEAYKKTRMLWEALHSTEVAILLGTQQPRIRFRHPPQRKSRIF